MTFLEKLASTISRNHSLVCVGLDPEPERLPDTISVWEFNREVVDATADLACAYKLNLAFYEALGDAGMAALKRTVKHIPDNIPVIGDAKRGDIGNTAKAYAKAMFAHFNFDAATVSPYLGFDSIEPFIQYQDRGVFILCRTSNAGAVDFQSLQCQTEDGLRPLYEIVALKASEWNKYGNIGLVVGATYPEELKQIRCSYPDMPLLVPGIGAQGGDLALTVRYGIDAGRNKTIINSSRQIIYASRGKDFAQAAHDAALSLRNDINRHLSNLAPD